VALATCADVAELDPDDRPLLPALAAQGIKAVPAVWDDRGVDWGSFDLVVLRSTWDYAERRDEFLAWARSLPRVLNDVPVLDWNTDKERYLTNLEAAGVPIVPTRFLPPGADFQSPGHPFVVKPTISAGGRSSAWFAPGEDGAARALVARIHAGGRTAMIQPHIADQPETAAVFVAGAYSHALRRHVRLPSAEHHDVLYLDERLEHADATAEQRRIAELAVAQAPGELLYARVDLIGNAVLELELTEPSLYFAFGGGSIERFACAIEVVLADTLSR